MVQFFCNISELTITNSQQQEWFLAQQRPGSLNNSAAGTPASLQTHSERGKGRQGKEVKGGKKMEREENGERRDKGGIMNT